MAEKILGWQEKQTKQYHKGLFVTIIPKVPRSPIDSNINASYQIDDSLKDVSIRGLLVSDDLNVSIDWESPFEGSNEGSSMGSLSSLVQSGIAQSFISNSSLLGRTTSNIIESVQVFKGVAPQELNLTLNFTAFSDPLIEVEYPIIALLKIMSPQLTLGGSTEVLKKVIDAISNNKDISLDDSVFGFIPYDVVLDYNNKRFSSDMRFVITNLSSNRDKIQIDKNGNAIKREVTLTLKSKKSMNRDDLILKI